MKITYIAPKIVRLSLRIGLISLSSLLLLSLLSGCSFPGLVNTSARLPQAPKSRTTPTLPPVHLPQDEGSHNNLTEWWYYTGHFKGTDATGKIHEYGFELVVFQVSRSDLPLLLPSHFAITDLARSEFHYDQRTVTATRAQIPLAATTNSINMHVADWSIQGANGHDHLQAHMQQYALDLSLAASKPAALHNETGLIPYGKGGYSYYYSRTHMAVTGSILDHNQPVQVTGLAWMDHQWGNFVTAGGGGWDWYSLQLDNNTELILYVIRDDKGVIISNYAGYIDTHGQSWLLSPAALHSSVLETWTSPTTHITYPSGWRIAIDDPHLRAMLTIKPVLKNQELITTASTGNIYWEGAVRVQGEQNARSLTGQGYVELTGYL